MPINETIDVPPDVASDMRALVRSGEFATEGDVARAAMEEWRARRAGVAESLASVRADIAVGLADLAEGRATAFDVDRIASLGRQASRSRSASD